MPVFVTSYVPDFMPSGAVILSAVMVMVPSVSGGVDVPPLSATVKSFAMPSEKCGWPSGEGRKHTNA